MIYNTTNSSFPSQIVPDAEKASLEYGSKVARAIENEWFQNGGSGSRFYTNQASFHNLRLYARGEQSIQKYKDELAINGDLSYLNLDWKPVPILPKFVDIVVNGISSKTYEINAFAQDPVALKERTEFAQNMMWDIEAKESIDSMKAQVGIDISKSLNTVKTPETVEELEMYMQLDYKQSIEIAEEEAINTVLDTNKYPLLNKRCNYDLTVLGIGAIKTGYNKAEGITINYVDPSNLVYSYTEDPNFGDLYYIGEVKSISIEELAKEFPDISGETLEALGKRAGSQRTSYTSTSYDNNKIDILYFEYKTFTHQVFKIKQTATGMEKAILKTDMFNPPENDSFNKVSRKIEVLYSEAKVLGGPEMLQWEMSENMTRPYANTTRVKMNYSIVAPRMYKGRIESLVSRATSFADMIQLTHLKLQQVLSRMVPDGVYLDADGLAEVDLGNGTNYNPAEALNMYFQTGSIIGRSMTQDGDLNHGKVPIQELSSSSGNGKIGALISTYQYYLQMIRDVTGLNEARDGSTPDPNALVGLQKLAAANSNTATRHILQSSLFLTLSTCENIALRIADVLSFSLTTESLKAAINVFNVNTLNEVTELGSRDFGIFLELEPEEEDKQLLEQNIQVALQSGQIFLEDAIDIRSIKNLKLANQSIKFRRKKKEEKDQAIQQANIQAQAQANAQATEAAAVAEVQKRQAVAETEIQIEKAKSQFAIEKAQQEAELKKQLMELEFQFNMQLAQANSDKIQADVKFKEDRKDERTKIQASQQSELIDQRKNNSLPKSFESAGFDNLGGFGLEQFDPK
jgi:hypothetical protein